MGACHGRRADCVIRRNFARIGSQVSELKRRGVCDPDVIDVKPDTPTGTMLAKFNIEPGTTRMKSVMGRGLSISICKWAVHRIE